MSIQAVKEYLALVWTQYQAASRNLKGQILDELCRNLQIHRKAAIRLLNSADSPRSQQGKKARSGRRPYSEEAKGHLAALWKLMGYMASIRLKAALPEWVGFYQGKDFTNEIRLEILAMSARSIERFLLPAKAELKRKLNTGTRRGVRPLVTTVPIRDLGNTPLVPGHCEVDSVAHCGGSLSGTFAWSVTLTDIATGWTECETVFGKTGAAVKKALKLMEERLPFKLTHLYFDNGSEFLNADVIEEFARSPERTVAIEVFRSRPYRKNDQCYVEQKNFTHVRQFFGYGRIDWENAVSMMNNVYRGYWRKVQNYYCPQQKLIEKQRIGSKIVRKMEEPRTPFERLRPHLTAAQCEKLNTEKAEINPISAMAKVRKAVRNIFGYFRNMEKAEWGKMVR